MDLVEGNLFKPMGKWKYEVKLDYSGIYTEEGNPVGREYLDPNEAALMALKQATDKGVSQVILEKPGDYHLVVFEPPAGFPVLVVSAAFTEIWDIFRKRV